MKAVTDDDREQKAVTDDDREQQRLWLGRDPCCDEDWGGSHYHCARCNETSSMLGHYTSVHWRNKPDKTLPHFCCPNDCELETDPAKVAEREEMRYGINLTSGT